MLEEGWTTDGKIETDRLIMAPAAAPMEKADLSVLHLLGLTSFMFATGLLLSTYGMITLALESYRLAPENASFALAGFLALAGVSQLVCPLAGYMSDRHVSRFGKRLPFIAGGSAVLACGLGIQWTSRAGALPGAASFDDDYDDASYSAGNPVALLSYGVAFLSSMLALNVAYTAATSLVPDLVPSRQTGIANGLAVFLQVLGSCFGFLYYFIVDDLDALYALYLTVVVVFSAITVAVAAAGAPKRRGGEKRPLRSGGDPSGGGAVETVEDRNPFLGEKGSGAGPALGAPLPREPFSWVAVRECYYVSPYDPATRDFFFVWVSRTLYYTGGSVQAFLVYYIRDRLDESSGGSAIDLWLAPYVTAADPARSTCVIALAGYVSGVLAAVPAGAISDRTGRKPVVVFACVMMSMSMIALGFSTRASAVVFWGLVGGFGNGAYQAVDLALAVDTLPNAEESARFMGVWGVGAFVGVCLGPVIGAPLLYVFGQIGDPAPPENGQWGYVALFVYGAASIFASAAVLIRYVKGAA